MLKRFAFVETVTENNFNKSELNSKFSFILQIIYNWAGQLWHLLDSINF